MNKRQRKKQRKIFGKLHCAKQLPHFSVLNRSHQINKAVYLGDGFYNNKNNYVDFNIEINQVNSGSGVGVFSNASGFNSNVDFFSSKISHSQLQGNTGLISYNPYNGYYYVFTSSNILCYNSSDVQTNVITLPVNGNTCLLSFSEYGNIYVSTIGNGLNSIYVVDGNVNNISTFNTVITTINVTAGYNPKAGFYYQNTNRTYVYSRDAAQNGIFTILDSKLNTIVSTFVIPFSSTANQNQQNNFCVAGNYLYFACNVVRRVHRVTLDLVPAYFDSFIVDSAPVGLCFNEKNNRVYITMNSNGICTYDIINDVISRSNISIPSSNGTPASNIIYNIKSQNTVALAALPDDNTGINKVLIYTLDKLGHICRYFTIDVGNIHNPEVSFLIYIKQEDLIVFGLTNNDSKLSTVYFVDSYGNLALTLDIPTLGYSATFNEDNNSLYFSSTNDLFSSTDYGFSKISITRNYTFLNTYIGNSAGSNLNAKLVLGSHVGVQGNARKYGLPFNASDGNIVVDNYGAGALKCQAFSQMTCNKPVIINEIKIISQFTDQLLNEVNYIVNDFNFDKKSLNITPLKTITKIDYNLNLLVIDEHALGVDGIILDANSRLEFIVTKNAKFSILLKVKMYANVANFVMV